MHEVSTEPHRIVIARSCAALESGACSSLTKPSQYRTGGHRAAKLERGGCDLESKLLRLRSRLSFSLLAFTWVRRSLLECQKSENVMSVGHYLDHDEDLQCSNPAFGPNLIAANRTSVQDIAVRMCRIIDPTSGAPLRSCKVYQSLCQNSSALRQCRASRSACVNR